MITLSIDGKPYPVQELTVDLWMELSKWDIQVDINWPRIIHIATGAPINQLLKATVEQQQLGAVLVAQQLTERVPNKKLDLSNITFGTFVDMETYLHWGLQKSLPDCLKTLEVETTVAAEALWILERYLEYRNHLYREYKGLFDTDEPDDEEVADGPRDPNSVPRAWYRIMVDIAQGDVLKLDDVAAQPVKKILNFMALQKQKAMEDNSRILKQNRQYELQSNRR